MLGGRYGQALDPSSFATVPRSLITMAGDISFIKRVRFGSSGQSLELGAALSDIGPKVSLYENSRKTFLPTRLSAGLAWLKANRENGNHFQLAFDASKLLVPTPPVYDNGGQIIAGKDPDRSVLNALFSSFSDAPGGFAEEFQEIRVCVGVELGLAHSFFLRSGVSIENKLKGNRKFIGLGVGYKEYIDDQSVQLDLYYLVPFGNTGAVSPFRNSFGLTLGVCIGNFE